jgi:hypothetical protein
MMIIRGDIVKRADGKPISLYPSPHLFEDRMFAMVVIGQGDTLHEYAWHYNATPDETISIDTIGIKIGLFPTWEKAADYIKIPDSEKDKIIKKYNLTSQCT